jgi:hypothetical protein
MKGALLDPRTADRLAKFCGMFGSAHDGERAAAAAKADALVRSLGLTWRDVVVPPIAADLPRSEETDWQRMARFCHARQGQLSPRNRDFIQTMLAWPGVPSAKQQAWLVDCYVQCGGAR